MNLSTLHNIPPCPIQEVQLSVFQNKKIKVDILREDLNHPHIQGNKLRKLKYNLIEAEHLGFRKILTFGGAYSNHIAAVAAAGKAFGFETIGVIRGQELAGKPFNPTLKKAQENGMKFQFVSRQEYRDKKSIDFLNKLKEKWGSVFIVPEGGSSPFAIPGVAEMVDSRFFNYDYISVAVGTGGTLAGLLEGLKNNIPVLGFPALKNADYLHEEVKKLTKFNNYEFINAYHFGGFGKISQDLVNFAQDLYLSTGILLDPLYTAKMFYGLADMAKNDFFESGKSILAVHTGGLQGIKGIKNNAWDF